MQYEVQAETVKFFGEPKPYSFVSLHQTYKVNDWPKAKQFMEQYMTSARSDFSCMYSGWTASGDTLVGRVAHADVDALVAHLRSVGPSIDGLTGVATLDDVSIHGPAEALAQFQSAVSSLDAPAPPPPPPAEPPKATGGLFGALFGGGGPPPPPPLGVGPNAQTAALLAERMSYYEISSGTSFITKESGGISTGQRFCSVERRYTVSDWALAEPLMEACNKQVESEGACIMFGWTKCGDAVYVRDGYASAKGVLLHIDNLNELAAQLVSDGACTLESTRIHGPMAQTQFVKDAFAKYGYGGPKPKSQFDGVEQDPRLATPVSDEEQAATEAAKAAAKAAAEKVEFFNVLSGFQRFEALRLGGFEQ